MSELPDGIPPAEVPKPRDSASGIVVRAPASADREVLLGVRSRRARFMPGQLAFPGGVLDAEDRHDGGDSFAHCVSREMREETGLALAPEAWVAAGARTTPPMFPLRFHTAFFLAELPEGAAEPAPQTEEIESLRFIRPAAVLAEWRDERVVVPPPVLPLLRALAELAESDLQGLARRVAAVNATEQQAPRIEFVPDVWMLPVQTATLPPATHTNVWIAGGRRFVVIDPGATDAAERARLEQVIERRRRAGGEPAAVLLTHHHRDHVGGAAALAQALDVPLRAHPTTLELLGIDGEPVDDDDEIDLDGTALRALHTPGHAAGHLAFHLPARELLIAGDLLSGLSTILIDPEQGDMGAYVTSLERARALGCRRLLPGHGPPLPGRALDRLIEHRGRREEKIIERLEPSGSALAQVATAAYDDVPQMPQPLIERQTLAHLLDLERRGRVRREDPQGRSWSPS